MFEIVFIHSIWQVVSLHRLFQSQSETDGAIFPIHTINSRGRTEYYFHTFSLSVQQLHLFLVIFPFEYKKKVKMGFGSPGTGVNPTKPTP